MYDAFRRARPAAARAPHPVTCHQHARGCRAPAATTRTTPGYAPYLRPRVLADRHEPRELGAAADAELAEDVAQVVLDGLGAHEQGGRRLPVGQPLGDELGDPELVRRQLGRVALGRGARAGAGRAQLAPRALGEAQGLDVLETGERRAQLLARLLAAALGPQPLAVRLASAGELERRGTGVVELQR